jgi:pimeloyl-ACP methyl ester carboxylesterase
MNQSSIYKSEAGQAKIMALYDSVLAKWPVPYSTQTLKTRHGDTHIIASGTILNQPLVLLYGSCSNAVSWAGVVKQFSPYFRVYAVDIPGEPGKSAPNRPDWNSPDFAEWMADLLDGLKMEKANFLGISQGGWTALKFAVNYPVRVSKLVVIAPAGVVPTRTSFIFKAVFYSMLGKWGAKSLNRITFGKEPVSPEVITYMNTIMTNFKPRIGKMLMFSDSELKALKMPALFIGGEQDPIQNNLKIANRLKMFLPDLTLKLFPDKGHVLIDATDIIIPFLKNDSSSS